MLKNISLFSSLKNGELKDLKAVVFKKKFPKNTIIFSEGDSSDSLYIVSSGKVKAVIHDEEGKEIILNLHGEGEYFGEMALIDGEPRSATIMTKEPTELLVISRKDFKRVVTSNPEMAFNLLAGVTRRLRRATQKIEGFAFLDVYGRIAKILKQYARKEGEKLVIEEKFTHQEIANMVGASREMVSRILKELTVGGFITVDKKRITIEKKIPDTF